MTPDLRGQLAVVTGASAGLGRAFARALARAGAHVALVARSADRLAAVADEIAADGGSATPYAADVTDPASAERIVRLTAADRGTPDLLVNAAGLGPPIGPFADADAAAWWRTVEVNLRGPMLWTRAVLPAMVARGSGRVVNVASGAGTVAIPYFSAYVTSKAALIRFSEVVAREVAGAGVCVFAIEPGTVRTAMAEQALESPEGRRWMPWFREIFEAGRDVTPEHSAELILWLAAGRGDALSGRFLSRADDFAARAAQADRITRGDGLTLRLVRPDSAT